MSKKVRAVRMNKQLQRMTPPQRARFAIALDMGPVIKEAMRLGLVFQQRYSGEWFTADALYQLMSKGRLVMGRRHWLARAADEMPVLRCFGAVTG